MITAAAAAASKPQLLRNQAQWLEYVDSHLHMMHELNLLLTNYEMVGWSCTAMALQAPDLHNNEYHSHG